MIRAWGSVAFVVAAATACSSTVTGTGSSSSGGSSSGASSSSGVTSSSSGGPSSSGSSGCGLSLYEVDTNCEPPFEQSCCAQWTTCTNDQSCESAALCKANCTLSDGCGCAADAPYLASLALCIRNHLDSACWLH